MEISIRPARPGDAGALAPLVYSSGPAAFDYVFSHKTKTSAVEFLTRALHTPGGEFGYDLHWVAELNGEVVGSAAGFTGERALAFMLSVIRRIISTYGPAEGIGVMIRGLRAESVIHPPRRDEYCVAHVGVRPDLRSRGIGSRLVRHLLDRARGEGRTLAVLDVSVENARAQALYERLGFVVTAERPSNLQNATARVPDHRRLELKL